MIIKYVNYSDGVHNIELRKSVKDLGLEDSFFGEVVLNCKMDKSYHQIFLDCDVSVNAKLVCDRCDEEYSTELKNNFKITYLFENKEEQDRDNGIKYLSHDVDKIDMTEEVLEYSILSVPMKKLCDEDCKGLCSVCGGNLNEKQCDCKIEINNSVWEPLKKFKDNN